MRTDVHSPTNLVTEDYEYVGASDNQAGDPGARRGILENYTMHGETVQAFSPVGAERIVLTRLVARHDPLERSIGQCHHCGAHLRYFAVLRHTPTGHYITVGETCLDNRFARATADFQRLRKAAELDRQAQRIKTAAFEFVQDLSDSDIRTALDRETDLAEEFPFLLDHRMEDPTQSYALRTILDIRRKLWDRYGSCSERQVEFVGKLLGEARERDSARRAREEREVNEVKIPAPQGRGQVVGTVVYRRGQDTMYGYVYKLLVKDDRGFKVWLTEPSAITCERGDRIKTTVTLTRSDRDECFAFGKRPAKTEKIGHLDNTPEEMPSALD